MILFTGQKDLRYFSRAVLHHHKILDALQAELGTKTPEVLQHLCQGRTLKEESVVLALIERVVKEESEYVENLFGVGPEGKFPIIIKRFGELYWASAPGFDDVGYFESYEGARSAAEFNYELFIAAYREHDVVHFDML